jgi:hypothetical protein
MKHRPLSLTDRKMQLLRGTASALPLDQRDGFLQNVASHLTGEPSDAAVQAAVNATLDRTPVFLCDALPTNRRAT